MNEKIYNLKRLEVIKRYKKGEAINNIAQELKMDKHQVRILIGRHKLGKKLKLDIGKRIERKKKLEIIKDIRSGKSADEISIIYDISRWSAQAIRREIDEEEKKECRGIRRSGKRVKRRKQDIKDSSTDKKNFRWGDIIKGIEVLREEYSLKEVLNGSGISRSAYYYHRKRKEEDRYKVVRKAIKEEHKRHSGRYGYRRIVLALLGRGYHINHKVVLRIMREEGLKNVVKKVRYRSYRGNVGKKAENVIARDFRAIGPNKKWATDISQVNIGGEKMYISPIQDMFNGEIISYTTSDRPDLGLVKGMLEKAFKKVKETRGIILHSDQGWHYQHYVYHKILREQGMIASMSRKGNCLDNAKMESFFGTMKKELLYAKKYESIEEFKKDLDKYVRYYNEERIKVNLKGLSPIKYRKVWETTNMM